MAILITDQRQETQPKARLSLLSPRQQCWLPWFHHMGTPNENDTNATDPRSIATTHCTTNGCSASSDTDSSSTSSNFEWADYVRIMLLSADHLRVLLRHMHQRWDLPYFIVTPKLNGNVTPCCSDFQRLLGFNSPYPVFNVVLELLGEYATLSPRGYDVSTLPGHGRLLLVESRINVDNIPLPDEFSWHDAQFVSAIQKDPEYDLVIEATFEVVTSFLTLQGPVNHLLPFPPFQCGWFDSAADWFVTRIEQLGIEVVGPIHQYRVTYSSIILRLKTKQEDFFLKSPRVGFPEILVTEQVSKLFPQNTPDLVATNEDLRAIITRGFDARSGDDRDQTQILRTLGCMQIESVSHVKNLIDAGVPSLLLEELGQKVTAWVHDESFKKCLCMMMPKFEALIPKLTAIIRELEKYNFPMCIVHGDFDERNTGFRTLGDGNEDMLIFDWQFSRISHPLFEFHQIHEDLTEDAVEAYLSIWDGYEPLHRAREAYDIAKILGWVVKIDASLPCVGTDVQKCPVLEEFVFNCFEYMQYATNQWFDSTSQDKLCIDSEEEK